MTTLIFIAALFVVFFGVIVPMLMVRGLERDLRSLPERLRRPGELALKPLSGPRFFLLGCGLFASKYAADAIMARLIFGINWLPWNYLAPTAVQRTGGFGGEFFAALAIVAIPFVWFGIGLTIRRLRTLGWSTWLALFFFPPGINFVFFVVLLFARPRATPQPVSPQYTALQRIALAAVLMVPFALLLLWWGTQVRNGYGWGVFVSVPFAVGFVSSALYNQPQARSRGGSIAVALFTVFLVGAGLFGLGIEGMVCMLMALPIVSPLAAAGALAAHLCARQGWTRPAAPPAVSACLLLMPGVMLSEAVLTLRPAPFVVVSSVVVHAPAERVWEKLVAFSEIPPPRELFFRAGVAYPIRAEIRGRGSGAIRYCIFSSGAFIEPIETWQSPRLLQFGVREQPATMRELSPFNIAPPHVAEDYFRATRGEFRLEPRSDGSVLLVGTTWYTLRYRPAAYWRFWSDAVVHRIHLRVLEHIKRESEAG